MKRVFVSSCRIDAPNAAAFISRLRSEDFFVMHSPRNPSDGKDERWRTWYDKGCREEMEQVEIFITVISYAWDCSTWMASEGHEALKLMAAGKLRKMYFYDPEHIEVKAKSMVLYMKEPLPDNLDEVIRVLKEEVS